MDPPITTTTTTTTATTTTPHVVVADVPIKRPPEDDDESLESLHRAPIKRQAIEATVSHGPGTASRASSEATDGHLLDMSPEELLSTIRHMQATHAREMAELRDQHAIVSRQLDQLRSLANRHLASQVLSIQAVQQNIAAIASPPPVVVPPRAAPTSTTTAPRSLSTPDRSAVPTSLAPVPSTIPQARADSTFATPRRELFGSPFTGTPGPPSGAAARAELRITPSPTPGEPPTVEPSSLDTVHEVWEEYRHGRGGNPPLESLDALWGPRWRPDPKLRAWYGRRKAILDKIRQYMADGIDEEDAVREVERMRRGRTLHYLSRLLLEDRKATKKQWKAAQKAATAAKQAMHGQPPAE